MKPNYYRSLWISDTHLGGRNLQEQNLLDFLQATESEYLYLVGDIIDFWKLNRRWFWPETNNKIISQILRKAASGTKVYYIPGNHDKILNRFSGHTISNIMVTEQVVHRAADGKKYLIMHGDQFDSVIKDKHRLAHFGALLYDIVLALNRRYNKVRTFIGRPYHSISAPMKRWVKHFFNYIGRFEHLLVAEAKKYQVDGLICGHTHHPMSKQIEGIMYRNSGDWVESCTAVAEQPNGMMRIIEWPHGLSTEKLGVTDEIEKDRYRDRCLAPTN
ncbi:MAG: UDP-2,3-diacylglucosamine diphosphatase [Desulfobulbaceae bacterium]|nr:MAG: UDP-2,3-diacylglucosamine diphosphatase [Desulfobulbaceae bacterium]